MIITTQEFKELGFECDEAYEDKLAGCIKRAEYVLNALSCGTLRSAMAQSEGNAVMIKQAVAFEADALLKAQLSDGLGKVSLGDLSYTTDARGEGEIPDAARKLLCAAGCFFGAGSVEVME